MQLISDTTILEKIVKKMKIPVYLIDINMDDDVTGMGAISFVDCPAIESNFIYFDKQTKPMMFQVENELEHKVTGCAIWCDKEIYRYDPAIGEYYVVFNKETIDKIVHKYAKQGLNNLVDLQHDGTMVDGVVMVEYFIKDTEKGINPKGFEEITDGSLFVTYKIEDDELWNEITRPDSEFKGFSIEINADIVPTEQYVEDDREDDDFWSWLDELLKALEEADCEIVMESDKKKDEWLIDGDGKYWLDEDGNKVPVKCPKCGGDVIVAIQGEPIFKCKECGEYLGTVMFPEDEFELDFEVERTDIAKAIDKGNQVKLKIGDGKIETAQIHSLGKKGNSDIAIVFYPNSNRWVDVPLKDISVLEPTKTPNIAFPDVPKNITDNDDITIQRNVNTMSYSELIHNRIPVMLTYDDDKPNPHTGYRQAAIIAYGYTKRGNECIRIMETFGDSRSAAEGEGFIPDYRLMLVRRIKSFKPMQGVQPWGMGILDSRVNMNGDRSMQPCVDHIKLSDFD